MVEPLGQCPLARSVERHCPVAVPRIPSGLGDGGHGSGSDRRLKRSEKRPLLFDAQESSRRSSLFSNHEGRIRSRATRRRSCSDSCGLGRVASSTGTLADRRVVLIVQSRSLSSDQSPLAAPIIASTSKIKIPMMITGIRHHAEVSHRQAPCTSDRIMETAMNRPIRPQQPPPPSELPDDLTSLDHQMGMMIHPLSSESRFLSLRLMGVLRSLMRHCREFG